MTFQRNIPLPYSGLKCTPIKKQGAFAALLTSFLLGLLSDPDDGGSVFLQVIVELQPNYIPLIIGFCILLRVIYIPLFYIP
jgi:hypothetical protein